MLNSINGKFVTLGVTGSIASYKAVDLASKLTQKGAKVDVIMTESSQKFVTPLAFQAVTHRTVSTTLFSTSSELGINHVALAERSDLVVVSPATATTMAKIALGLAPDSLTSTILATKAPVLIAPAMDANMYDNIATQENVRKLKSRGFLIVGPSVGRLASGLQGRGRLVETDELMRHIESSLHKISDLKGFKILVSAGGTKESIDPVRFISNRSSGKMGYSIAEAAGSRGAETVLVSATTSLPEPTNTRVINVETAVQMREAIIKESVEADALIMAAAVSDWRPVKTSTRKLKKTQHDTMKIELEKNPDILKEIHGDKLVKVGFAAETENIIANAKVKILEKDLHLIVANDITASDSGFGSDNNKVYILDRSNVVEELPLMTKLKVGHHILDRVATLIR